MNKNLNVVFFNVNNFKYSKNLIILKMNNSTYFENETCTAERGPGVVDVKHFHPEETHALLGRAALVRGGHRQAVSAALLVRQHRLGAHHPSHGVDGEGGEAVAGLGT